MKLSPHLLQFLYTNKELTLAGIGRFRIAAQSGYEEANDKTSRTFNPSNISFEQDISAKTDPELVSFIAAQSGKMKSLAAADLDSYLELSKQFLNIGKPFFIEGIGTLTKNQTGQFDFSPANISHEKGKESILTETDQTSSTEDSFKNYEEMFSPKKPQTAASKKIVLWLAILAGIGLTIWGGYFVYKKTKKQTDQESESVITTDSSSSFISLPDSSSLQIKTNSAGNRLYKFVIEEAIKSRALARYNDLRKWGIDVQMETIDSVMFKLFFNLAASPADTARLKDSLGLLYSTMGKTTIEK